MSYICCFATSFGIWIRLSFVLIDIWREIRDGLRRGSIDGATNVTVDDDVVVAVDDDDDDDGTNRSKNDDKGNEVLNSGVGDGFNGVELFEWNKLVILL